MSTDTTPLQRRINFVVRLVICLVVLMSGAILAQAALEGFSLVRVVQTTAVLSGLVPTGSSSWSRWPTLSARRRPGFRSSWARDHAEHAV